MGGRLGQGRQQGSIDILPVGVLRGVVKKDRKPMPRDRLEAYATLLR